jgi:hypothetical protein
LLELPIQVVAEAVEVEQQPPEAVEQEAQE